MPSNSCGVLPARSLRSSELCSEIFLIGTFLINHALNSVVIETMWLARVEPLLPRTFQSDDIVEFHVWRDALEDRKSEIPGIALPEQAITSMPTGGVV